MSVLNMLQERPTSAKEQYLLFGRLDESAHLLGSRDWVLKHRALFWLEKSAKQGFPAAVRTFANRCDLGLTGPTAVDAMRFYATWYASGTNWENPEMERFWYDKAAERKITSVEEVRRYWRTIADEQEAIETKDAAEHGNVNAQSKLGKFYLNGRGVPKDVDQGVYWITKAAEQGEGNAQYSLGEIFAIGTAIPKDMEKAIYWYAKANENGNLPAKYALGVNYYKGNGVPQNVVKAEDLISSAATLGHEDAKKELHNLGMDYYNGNGVPKNATKAEELMASAAKFGHEDAKKTLYGFGISYYNGSGVPKDEAKAKKLITLVAETGYEGAKTALVRLNAGKPPEKTKAEERNDTIIGCVIIVVFLALCATGVYFLIRPGKGSRSASDHSESVVEMEKESGGFVDARDGQKYNAATIGNYTWMVRNLNYQPATGRSWCYDNGSSNCNKYGRLYDWNTAKAACPAGWHLPSRREWADLAATAGGDAAGTALKTENGWVDYGNGTDIYGFSAQPSGSRAIDGSFKNVGNRGLWWVGTEYDSDSAYYRRMGYNYDYVYEGTFGKGHGFSVRCVED